MSLQIEREQPDLSSIPPQFQKSADPESPEKMRMMAANGMLPLSPEQNVLLLYALSFDPSQQIQQAAKMSVTDLPPEILAPVLTSTEEVGLLDWIADERSDNAEILENVVTNRNAHERTIARVARRGDAKMVEIVATNQVRLLESPIIIEQMYLNPNARVATVDRIIDLAQRNGVKLKGIPGLNEAMESGQDLFSGATDADSFERLLQNETHKAAKEDEENEKLEQMSRSERERWEEENDLNEEELERKPLHAQISNMSIAQKIWLAMVGSREAVHILVRDPNKLVHMAAVKSPRVKYPDAARWAKNKSMPDGVINYIANNRDWTQSYECKLNLVNNPKTPLSEVLSLMNHLRSNDLKQLMRSRNVPMQVVRQAKNLYKKRTGGGRR